MPSPSPMERWATFDCYGTLVDWESGIAGTLGRLWPAADRERLLRAYHRAEPLVQEAEPTTPYREVTARALEAMAAAEGLTLDGKERDALARSLPGWPVFPEVPGALHDIRSRRWRVGILSNTDPDLLEASMAAIGVEPDLVVTAREAGSYKPAPGHWLVFRERSGVERDRHVHVGASLFHDVAPAAELGIPVVWINRLRESGEVPRAAELLDLSELPGVLDAILPAS